MFALGDVIARIRAALGQISNARRALGQAGDYLGEANQYLTRSFEGSRAPEAEQALGLLAHAGTGIDGASGVLVEAEGGIQGYVNSLTGGITEGLPPAVKSGPARQPEPVSPAHSCRSGSSSFATSWFPYCSPKGAH